MENVRGKAEIMRRPYGQREQAYPMVDVEVYDQREPACRMMDVEVCYVTRTYLTRHGAGPFPEECGKDEINPDMRDLTNVPNPHQGTLRYGRLDEKAFIRRIREDFDRLIAEYSASSSTPSICSGKISFRIFSSGVQNARLRPIRVS